MVNDFLDSIPKEILTRSKDLDLDIRSSNAHQAIDEILSKTVLKGGKRLRPLLTFLMGNLFQANFDQLSPYARSTELVHAASLSHDDVIDNATLRRGAPSINILASNKKAVLAGDYLLSKVIVDLCAAGNLELVREMSLVIKDLSEGEWLQLDLQKSRNYTSELIEEVAMKKTSSVMSYCTQASAILTNQSTEVIKLSKDFGIHLGLAFQLIDDTLDFSGESLKDSMLDLENGVVNAVFYDYLNSHPELFNRFKNGESLTDLIDIKNLQTSVVNISNKANYHLEQALMALANIESKITSKYSAEHIENSSQYLKLIVSYLALRKS